MFHRSVHCASAYPARLYKFSCRIYHQLSIFTHQRLAGLDGTQNTRTSPSSVRYTQFAATFRAINVFCMSEYIFREVVYNDVPKLAQLHAVAWKETYELIYPDTTDFPTAELREWQWRDLFKKNPKSWFCYVVENADSELIGFAKGQEYNHQNYPGIQGELNKIYVLRKYHKQGIGIKLFRLIVSTLISKGINNMILFTDNNNPTIKFFERLGGKKTLSSNGESHDAYTWNSLDIFR